VTHPSPFRIAVIGCGWIALSQHGPACARYAAQNAGVELAACCDLDEARAAQFANRFGFRRVYTNWADMLRLERPAAVCLNVPPEHTAGIACAILRLGFPLLLEKPPGLVVSEIDELIASAQASGAPHQVAFNRRFTPLVRQLKRLLVEGPPATPQHIQYEMVRVGRTDPDFTTTAIHGIDLVRFLAGSDYAQIYFRYQDLHPLQFDLPPSQEPLHSPVIAPASSLEPPRPPVTNFILDCLLTSGATAHLSFLPLSGAVLERAAVHVQDQVFFLHLPIWNGFDAPGRLQWVEKGQGRGAWSGPELSPGAEDFVLNGFWDEDASFFDDIQQGRSPRCDLQSARQSVEVMQALRERWEVYPRI
jgi:predicted dehydrogenase